MPKKSNRKDPGKVEAEIELDASLEEVWKALTDAEELTHWFPLEARVEPGPGGKMWISWGKDFEGESQIEVWEPPHRIKTATDVTLDSDEGKSKLIAVDYRLEAKGGKTILRLVHSGFGTGDGWEDEYDSVSRGWPFELLGLKHYLEQHRGKKRSVVWVRVLVDLTPETIWQRLRSKRGFFAEGELEGVSPGARYSFRTANDDRFEGILHVFNPPLDFYGTVQNLGNGLLRANVFGQGGRCDLQIWISTYGLRQKRLDELRRSWRRLLGDLFPEGELR